MGERPGGTGSVDLAILAYATALLLLWSPSLHLGMLTPRTLVMLTALGPGLVVTAGLARRGDRAAQWVAGYLIWAMVAVIWAPQPWKALAGTYGTDVGWIYLAGYFSAWGLGRRLSAPGRRALRAVILIGIAVNGLFGVLEAVLDPSGDLATEAGRVHGLISNSLFLGGLLVGALAALGLLVGSGSSRRVLLLPMTALLVMAVNLTGSRVALVGGVLLAVAATLVGARRTFGIGGSISLDTVEPPDDGNIEHRFTSKTVRRTLPMIGAIALGFALSLPLQGAESSSARLGETATSSGYVSRALMWRAGLEAVGERPLAGWGPGRFGEATASRTTAAFVRAEGHDKLFYDAHNLVIEHLVTTGVVGLVLLLAFAWCALRHARGALAWLGGGIALTWLTNPVSITTGTVALLAIGAAWREDMVAGDEADVFGAERLSPGESADTPPNRSVWVARLVGSVLAAIGLVAGGILVRADAYLDNGVATGNVPAVQAASELLPWDSVVTGILAEAYVQEAGASPSAMQARRIMTTTRRAVRQDPTRAYWWVRLGFREFEYGSGTESHRLERARLAFDEALRRSPWSATALLGLRGVALKQENQAEVDRISGLLCEIGVCTEP